MINRRTFCVPIYFILPASNQPTSLTDGQLWPSRKILGTPVILKPHTPTSTVIPHNPEAQQGIEDINDAIKATKIIRDGQILIQKGEKTFDLQGQELK